MCEDIYFFPRMLRVPRTKYFIDLWPERWEKNADREGVAERCQSMLPFCQEMVAARDTSELTLALLSGCLVCFLRGYETHGPGLNSSFSRVFLLRWDWAWQWTCLWILTVVCSRPQSSRTAHNPTEEWEWGMGAGMGVGRDRLTGMLPSRWSCHLAEKMWGDGMVGRTWVILLAIRALGLDSENLGSSKLGLPGADGPQHSCRWWWLTLSWPHLHSVGAACSACFIRLSCTSLESCRRVGYSP